MNKNQLAAALIAGSSILWACGNNNNKDKEGTNVTTSETTLDTGSTSTMGGTGAALDTMGQNFAMQAASSDMLEIQSSNMAMQSASNDRVKSFATMMIRDHGQTSTQLKELVAGRGVNLPTDLMPQHRAMLTNLQGKTGKNFDRAYMDMQVKAHQESVSLFQRASNGVNDGQLKGFATQHLPHLRMHLDSAQAIGGGLK
jgi:putative membrane protein